jgi:hypothetical protein
MYNNKSIENISKFYFDKSLKFFTIWTTLLWIGSLTQIILLSNKQTIIIGDLTYKQLSAVNLTSSNHGGEDVGRN